MSLNTPTTEPGKTPGVIVVALVLSIFGFVCGIPAIVGMILGIVNRPKAKAAGSGVGMATAAIIIGAGWIAIGLLGGIIAVASGGSSSSSSTPPAVAPTQPPAAESAPASEVSPTEEEEVTGDVSEAPAAPQDSSTEETVSQANAREKAQSYLEFSAFSRKGLIDQLKFEGFSEADAKYGADAVGADWTEQAAKKAQSYLETSAFSREGLIKQLKFEGFSDADATYGTDAVGADWNEQAAKKAQSYLEFSAFSRKGLIDQLKFEGFTTAQATYGVDAVGL